MSLRMSPGPNPSQSRIDSESILIDPDRTGSTPGLSKIDRRLRIVTVSIFDRHRVDHGSIGDGRAQGRLLFESRVTSRPIHDRLPT